jgi:ABC-type multidrug transport system fused ATPase/permease subunit
VLVAGVVVVTILIDWRIGIVVTLTTVASVTVMLALRSRAVVANEREREAAAQLYGDLEERLGGLEDLRANGGGAHALHRLETLSARLWRTTRQAWGRAHGAYALSAATFALGSTATLAAGAWLHRRGTMSLGVVLALFRYAQMVRVPLERAAEQLPELQRALAGTSRAAALLAEQPTVRWPAPADAVPLPAGALAVDLDGVELAYGDRRAPRALHSVELHLAPGATLGVVGRSGSGKTTLGRLLVRFWDPTSGTVRLGGVDLRAVTAADLRRRVAVVTQDVELLRASVRDNLTVLGAADADDDRLRAVLDDVGLGPWLQRLPLGIDTVLDDAVGLSAGEAQLLALARAFLSDPGLVVLDEASSRLDPDTEAAVARATDRLVTGRTAVVIAHRLATLDRVDEIAVIDAGEVVEHGRRAALAADPSSRFAALLAHHAEAALA